MKGYTMSNYKTLHKVEFVLAATSSSTITQLTDIRNLNDVTILHYEEKIINETWNIRNLISLSMVIALEDYGDAVNDASLFLDTIFANSYIEVISYEEKQITVTKNGYAIHNGSDNA
tara:strand:+ start:1268 stop:1618 length:351 start_codon:yes stop_codon:yes gene_type:complete